MSICVWLKVMWFYEDESWRLGFNFGERIVFVCNEKIGDLYEGFEIRNK